MNKDEKTPPITVIYGNEPNCMTELLLSSVNLGSSIPKGSSIGIKPNLVVAKPAHKGGTTTPEVVEGIIKHLQAHGHTHITILEGSWIGDSTKRAYKKCGYQQISETYNVPLIDTKDDDVISVKVGGTSYKVCRSVSDVDVLINVPVLKGHCQTLMTGALKNMKGCIPDSEKRRYHSMGLHDPIADINQVIKPDWIVMDALCGDLGFEEGGNPSTMHRMMVSRDPVLLDSYGCTLMGLDAHDVDYIIKAADFGIGELYDKDEADTLLELNSPQNSYDLPTFDRSFEGLIDQRDACSACYGSLVRALLETDDEIYDLVVKANKKMEKPVFAIGQAFEQIEPWPYGEGTLGIGSCTAQGGTHVRGCPPNPEKIKEALRAFIS